MKHHFINFLSDAGHSVEGYEHKLLQKFAAFVESFEAKQDEPAPVAETPAPVVDTPVAADPAPAPAPVVEADPAPATPAASA
jgi:hypothetical protein